MGVVYKAYDALIKRPVAVKTLNDIRDAAALQLFYKEWGVLASLVHPNIVQVYDVGKFDADGETVPFFVMPLLPGETLSKLIYDNSHPLTIARAVDIICQACRGIQAAHDAKLVHRDIKPSNILVLDDDSVKIIDFGVAHLVGKEGTTGLKGTPYYMAPEQIRLQGPSALTDIYSLGVVAYEALTGRRPIQGSSDAEISDAILNHIPPSASDLNPTIDQMMSRVLHKAMAKHPWHRFSSAREFGEALQKVMRNEPIEIFDPSRIQPRIERAQRAFEGGDFAFASEVLGELEGEGCLDQEITLLRRKLIERQRKDHIRTLIEGAARCFEEQEYALALRKVQEALALDPHDGDVLSLKTRIETASLPHKIGDWMSRAQRHLENGALAQARKVLQSVLEAQPGEPEAQRLLALVNERETEHVRAGEQKSRPQPALSGSPRPLIRDSKREEAVSWCLAKARQLQREGKAEEAFQLVGRVLETYPGVSRLEQLRETLRPLEASPVDAARARDLEELQRMARQAGLSGGQIVAGGVAARAEQIERNWPGDAEISARAAEVYRKLREQHDPDFAAIPAKPLARALTASGEWEASPATSEAAAARRAAAAGYGGAVTDAPHREAPGAEGPGAGASGMGAPGYGTFGGEPGVPREPAGTAASNIAPSGRQAGAAKQTAAPKAARQAGETQARLLNVVSAAALIGRRGARNVYVWVAAAAVLGLILAVVAAALLKRTPPAAPPAALAGLQMKIEPAGAKVVLSGGENFECTAPDCALNVPAGDYTLTASLAGYRPVHETVSIEAGSPNALAFALEPLPVLLRLISDLQRASVRVDGEEIATPVEEGFLELILSPGVYPVEVRSGSSSASLVVDVAPGRAPRFGEAIQARELQVYALASFGDSAELRSSAESVGVQVDGQESGAATEGVLQLAGLSAGLHELTFTTAEGQIRRSFEISEEPALTAVLITDRNLGSLLVEAGVEGAEVSINDGRYRKQTAGSGRVRLWLAPGEYTAAAAKDGHEPAAPQAFTIRKGDETRLEFALPVKPQMARLEIAGAPAGAEVWLDDKRIGQVDRGGAFGTSVPAGSHRVALRNLPEMYASQEIEKSFAEGATVAFSGDGLPLRAVKGKVQIQVEPEGVGASITIKQDGGSAQPAQAGIHYRDAGDYVVSASAPGFQTSEDGRRVTVGQTTVFHLTLRREAVEQPRRRFGFEDLAKIPGFENINGVMVRNGGEVAPLPFTPSAGSYTFTANVRGGGLFSLRHVGIGRPRLQWVVDYSDNGTYVLFEFGENALSRTLVSGGKRGETVKIAHECPKSEYYSISVNLSAASVTNKVLCGGQWVVLERWDSQGANLADGKFGFFVPNKSTLAISHFEAIAP
jgi:tetratricopeptide (TPR) repeat protein